MAPPTHPNHPLAPATAGRHPSADRRLKNLAERFDPKKIQGSQGVPTVAIVDSRPSYEVGLNQIGVQTPDPTGKEVPRDSELDMGTPLHRRICVE
jgi:hypothetical protein